MNSFKTLSDGKKFVFNFGAFLFGPLWMLYRKQYLTAFLFLVVYWSVYWTVWEVSHYFIPDNLEEALSTYQTLDQFRILLYAFLCVAIGIYGNTLYLKLIDRKVSKETMSGSSAEQILHRLQLSGGVSFAAPFFFIIIIVVVIAISALVVFNTFSALFGF